MGDYLIKRIGSAVLVILSVTMITFLVLHSISGNAAMLKLGTDATREQLAALQEQMGLNLPWYEQYFRWIGELLHGNLGRSILYGESVNTLILQRLPVTLSLAAFSMLMSIAISLMLGILSAIYRNRAIDIFSRTLMQVGTAVPAFWVSLLFILFFSLHLRWFPSSGFTPLRDGLLPFLQSIFLPSLVLSLGESGALIRSLRTSMLHSLKQDYIEMAKAQGLPAWKIYLKYALRSSLTAPITTAGLQFAKLLGGTTIVESVFALPGLGRLVLISVEQRDIPLLQGSVMFITLVVVVMSLLVDVLVAFLNPRVRISMGGNA